MRRGHLRAIFGLLLGAAVLGSVGCGSSSSGHSETKAEFVSQGNQICRQADKERFEALRAAGRKYGVTEGAHVSRATQEKIIIAGLPSYEAAAQKLGEIAPDGEEEGVDALIEAMEEAAEQVKVNPGTAVVSPVQFKKANELALRYGLKECTS